MMKNKVVQDAARQLPEEHQQLLSTFVNAERDWPRPDDLTRNATLDAFRSRLEEIRTQLAAHFAVEESDGYFAEVLALAPQFIHSADHLRRDHRELLEAFDALLKEVRTAEPSPAAWAAASQQFRQLAQMLQAHEHAENELLLAALDDETGTID